MLSRRGVFFSAALLPAIGRPGELVPIPKAKRHLIVLMDADMYHHRDMAFVAQWLGEKGYEAVVIPSLGEVGFRILDLDGAPAPNTGLLQEVKTLLVEMRER